MNTIWVCFFSNFTPMIQSVFSTIAKIAICGFVLLHVSCTRKEGCTDFRAENYDPSAEKDNGECFLARDKFIGLYIGNASCSQTIGGQFECTIREANDNLYDVIIENLGGFVQKDIRATISGNNIIIDQDNNAPDGEFVNGNGIIIGNLINLELSYGYAGLSANCQIEMQK